MRRLSVLLLSLCTLSGVGLSCSDQPAAHGPSISSVQDQNKSIATRLGDSADTIRHETTALRPVTKGTPEAAPHLDSIDAETDKLRALRTELDKSNAGLDAAKKQCDSLAAENVKLKDQAQQALNSKLNALIVTFSVLLGLSFLLVWFAGPKGFIAPVACGGVIVALLTVKVAVLYAVWIAAGAGVCIVAALAYYAYQHRSLRNLINAPEHTGK